MGLCLCTCSYTCVYVLILQFYVTQVLVRYDNLSYHFFITELYVAYQKRRERTTLSVKPEALENTDIAQFCPHKGYESQRLLV